MRLNGVTKGHIRKRAIGGFIGLGIGYLRGKYGAPGVTRTPGQWFRKPLLCPPELRGQGRE